MLKSLAVIAVLAFGQNAALVCAANCGATAVQSEGCHEPAGACAASASRHCAGSPAAVSATTDIAGRTVLPAPAATMLQAALVDVAPRPARSLSVACRNAAPTGTRLLQLRI